jgi:hypothetical protein
MTRPRTEKKNTLQVSENNRGAGKPEDLGYYENGKLENSEM